MEAIQELDCSNYQIVYDAFYHHICPNTSDIIEYKYSLSCPGLVHLSGVESFIPIEQYRDNHRVLLTAKDRFRNKEQIELLFKLGYKGYISF